MPIDGRLADIQVVAQLSLDLIGLIIKFCGQFQVQFRHPFLLTIRIGPGDRLVWF